MQLILTVCYVPKCCLHSSHNTKNISSLQLSFLITIFTNKEEVGDTEAFAF